MGIFDDIGDAASDAADTVTDAASDAADTVTDAASDAADTVTNTASDAVDAVTGGSDSDGGADESGSNSTSANSSTGDISSGSDNSSTGSTSGSSGGSNGGGGVVEEFRETADDTVDTVTEAASEAEETVSNAAENTVDRVTEAGNDVVNDAGEFVDEATDPVEDAVDFVRSGEDEPSVGDEEFRDELLGRGDDSKTDSDNNPKQNNREIGPQNQTISDQNSSNRSNKTRIDDSLNINATDTLNESEIGNETRQDIISRAANNSELNESEIRVDQLLIGQRPDTPADIQEQLPEDTRRDLREQAAQGTPLGPDDLAITSVEETDDGTEVSFEAAETQADIERTEEGLENAVNDAISRLDEQIEGQKIDQDDVQVTRTESGGIEVGLTPQAKSRSQPVVTNASLQGHAVRTSDSIGTVTATGSASENDNLVGLITGSGDADDIEGGIEIAGTTVVAKGEDFPESAEEVPMALTEDAELVQSEIPSTSRGRREAVSNTLQDATGIEAQAPIRNTRRDALNAVESTFNDLRNGNATEAGGVAGAAGLAVAAPEPVSTTTGAAVLGGLAIAGGVAAVSNEQSEIDAPEERGDLPGEGINEIENPQGSESVTTTVEIESPEDRSAIPGEGDGELAAPDDRSNLPGEGDGEIDSPNDRGDLPGENTPSEGDLTILTASTIVDSGNAGITGPQEPSIDGTQEPSITDDATQNRNDRQIQTGEGAIVGRDNQAVEEPTVTEEEASNPEISQEEAIENALQRVDQSGPLETSVASSEAISNRQSNNQGVQLAATTASLNLLATSAVQSNAQQYQNPFENFNSNQTAEPTSTLTEPQPNSTESRKRRRPRRLRFDDESDGFETTDATTAQSVDDGNRWLSAGWLNEFTTAFAVGPGPRNAPTQDRLEESDSGLLLSGQLPTETQLTAEGEEAEAITAAEETFFAGFVDQDDGGGGLL